MHAHVHLSALQLNATCADGTRIVMTIAGTTLRVVVSNSADTVFVWSIPLGGSRAYTDGTCPANLDGTISRDPGSSFGTALAISENGHTLVIGGPGSASNPGLASVVVADITPPPLSPSPGTSAASLATTPGTPEVGSTALDSTYYQTNPSTVLISPRRGTVGVPAPQKFSLSSWAAGSPGGAPYAASNGYSISPNDPYESGGTPVRASLVGVTSALRGLGLTTAALQAAASSGVGP